MKFLSFILPLLVATNVLSKDVITKVHDGDTVTTASGVHIRLACIDAPEVTNNKHGKKDPVLGPASRNWLASMVLNKPVMIRKVTTDLYGRTVAVLYLEDGTEVNELSYKTGHSKIYLAKACPWSVSKPTQATP